MAEAKKPAFAKPISDVAHPGKSAPSVTSKPVIVSNRPLLHDPMMTAPADDTSTEAKTDDQAPKAAPGASKAVAGPRVIAPLETTPEAEPKDSEPAKTDDQATDAAETVPADDTSNTATDDKPAPTDEPVDGAHNGDAKVEQQAEAEAAKQAEHDASIQKLVDGKKYYLPINSIEQRKSKRFVIVGVLLAVILAVAWVDIALDAGLISLGNIHPVTHFFSN